MFDRMIDNITNGTGSLIEHEGKKYVQIDQNSWTSDVGWVTCKLVIELRNKNNAWGVAELSEVKALILVKPNA